MYELNSSEYSSVADFIPLINCDTVFAYSIIENKQRGRIFVDNKTSPNTVVIWHYCGFAYVAGSYENDSANQMIISLLCKRFEDNQRRFCLLLNNSKWTNTINKLLADSPDINIFNRIQFRFNNNSYNQISLFLPNDFSLQEMDLKILNELKGNIIPSFSWHSIEAFLSNGKGYCLMDKEIIACNAFSSSIGHGVIDIGIETNTIYRNKGFAAPTASAMIRYCLENEFQPCWGCHEKNIGSIRTAQKVGFEIAGSHLVYVKQ